MHLPGDFKIAEEFFHFRRLAHVAQREPTVDFRRIGILGREPRFEFAEFVDLASVGFTVR
jgi:hypothetical protein